jgi:YVTN family beta-propeller protein
VEKFRSHGNSISEIDPNTNTVIRTIPVPGQHPLGLAFVR